jgi:hypothetical protein
MEDNKPTREELKERLRGKISQKKSQRSYNTFNRKKATECAEKLKKITSIIDKYNITNEDKIPDKLVDEIKCVISEEDINLLVSYLKQNNSSNLNSNIINFLNEIAS